MSFRRYRPTALIIINDPLPPQLRSGSHYDAFITPEEIDAVGAFTIKRLKERVTV